MEILSERGHSFTTAEREIVRNVKEVLAYIALDLDTGMKEASEGSDKDQAHEFPDGNIIDCFSSSIAPCLQEQPRFSHFALCKLNPRPTHLSFQDVPCLSSHLALTCEESTGVIAMNKGCNEDLDTETTEAEIEENLLKESH